MNKYKNKITKSELQIDLWTEYLIENKLNIIPKEIKNNKTNEYSEIELLNKEFEEECFGCQPYPELAIEDFYEGSDD